MAYRYGIDAVVLPGFCAAISGAFLAHARGAAEPAMVCTGHHSPLHRQSFHFTLQQRSTSGSALSRR
jgi:hypothetical protein